MKMKKYPVIAKKHPISSKSEAREGELIDVRAHAMEPMGAFGRSFLSFTYSYTEIIGDGRAARVKAHRARYENGRLQSERFEGELDPARYDRAVEDAQRQFAEHATAMMRFMLSFFPVFGKSRSQGD